MTAVSKVEPATVDPRVIAARLDRLPILRSHRIWVVVLAVNLALEYYDNALFAYVLPAIGESTGMSTTQLGSVTTLFFVGMMFGSILGGRLADQYGRRTVLVWSTALYSVGAIATAVSSDFWSMGIARFVTGLGCQAASTILLVYLAEMFPSRSRGRFLTIMTGGFVVIAPAIALLARFAIPNGGPDTWRHLFFIGGVGVLIAISVRMLLPESVRWQIGAGQIADAESLVAKLEAEARRTGPLSEPEVVNEVVLGEARSLKALFANWKAMRVILVVSIGYFGTTLGYYLFANWGVYSLIEGLGYDEVKAYDVQIVWNVVYCVTPLVALAVMDRFERKTVILWSSVLSALPLIVLGYSSTSWAVMVAGGIAAIVTGVVITAFYAYIPESIPAEGRGLGSGIILGAGRVGGAMSGVLGAALFNAGGLGGIMIAAGACYAVFAFATYFFGPRTTSRSLEDVAA